MKRDDQFDSVGLYIQLLAVDRDLRLARTHHIVNVRELLEEQKQLATTLHIAVSGTMP